MPRMRNVRHSSPKPTRAAAASGRFDDAVEGLHQPFVILDEKERLVSWNPAFAALHRENDGRCILRPGLSIDDLTAWRLRNGFFLSATENNSLGLANTVARYQAQGSRIYQLGDGRWVLVERYPLLDGHHVGVWTDVTELKRTEAELSRIQSELKATNEDLERRVRERTQELVAVQDALVKEHRLSAIGQLTATVAHELRNPMSAIKNTVYALKDLVTAGDSRFERPLARIERSIERCNKIIEELLDFSQMRELQLESFVFDAWLREVAAKLELPPEIALVPEFGAAETLVKLDSDRMRRVIVHLVENASHALLAGGSREGAPRIVIRTRAQDDLLALELEDNGPGIAPEILPQVFEPLFSTKNFGTGLGLPTVKQILVQHGGDIELTSEIGRFTRATIRLPRVT